MVPISAGAADAVSAVGAVGAVVRGGRGGCGGARWVRWCAVGRAEQRVRSGCEGNLSGQCLCADPAATSSPVATSVPSPVVSSWSPPHCSCSRSGPSGGRALGRSSRSSPPPALRSGRLRALKRLMVTCRCDRCRGHGGCRRCRECSGAAAGRGTCRCTGLIRRCASRKECAGLAPGDCASLVPGDCGGLETGLQLLTPASDRIGSGFTAGFNLASGLLVIWSCRLNRHRHQRNRYAIAQASSRRSDARLRGTRHAVDGIYYGWEVGVERRSFFSSSSSDVTTSAVTTRVVSTWLFRLNGVYRPF